MGQKRRVMLTYVYTQYKAFGTPIKGLGSMYRDLEPGELLTSDWIAKQAYAASQIDPTRTIDIIGATVLENFIEPEKEG